MKGSEQLTLDQLKAYTANLRKALDDVDNWADEEIDRARRAPVTVFVSFNFDAWLARAMNGSPATRPRQTRKSTAKSQMSLILEALDEGPHTRYMLWTYLANNGNPAKNTNHVSALLSRLKKDGKVESGEEGFWALREGGQS